MNEIIEVCTYISCIFVIGFIYSYAMKIMTMHKRALTAVFAGWLLITFVIASNFLK